MAAKPGRPGEAWTLLQSGCDRGGVGRRARLVLGGGAVAALALTGALLATGGDRDSTPVPARAGPGPVAQAPSPAPTDPALLLPNVRSLGASDLLVERDGRARLLRFSASLANLGPGPLLLRPARRPGCPPGQHPAAQRLHRDGDGDGVFQRGRDPLSRDRVFVGCMLRHPGHDHWHFGAMARYALRRPGDTAPLVSRDKVSFCLRDNVRVPGQPVVVPEAVFGECTRWSRQGISPGWVDVYVAQLDGQTLRLPPGVDGHLLCLDLAADPLGVLRETDETDNATSIGVRVERREARRVATDRCR
ncbi:MAG TPA: lysyl oxidase family protein [Nocardioidaceae bacterium]|nr:lysyl oxidase family protein [Nocardioidaceae bacterium]